MKQMWKKIAGACMVGACVLSLSACQGPAESESALDETLSSQMTTTAQGLTETIIPLSDEEIDAYSESGDDFTEAAMESWVGAKDELGEFKESGSAQVKESNDGTYSVTIPAEFEKADANFVYVFGDDGIPTSMSVDVQYSMAVTLERAALNTLMGLGTVFVMLVFLSFVISLFKYIPKLVEGKKKQEPAKEPEAAPVVEAAPAVEETDDTELVAVIAAAIAAAEGTTPDGFVVRSIRKVNRKKW